VRISVITPSFNQGRFLRDCIESVRTQEGVEWEHIVIDGGSTDETLEILKSFPHLQWISEPDLGQSDAINKGFLRATGDWVMWLNGDDYLLPGALAAIREYAQGHAEADVLYGDWDFVDAEKKVTRRMRAFPFDLHLLIYHGCYIASTACFYRKATTIDAGFLLDVQFRQCMDQEYYARLGRAGKRFVYCPAKIAAFRLHGDNASMRYLHAGKQDMETILRREKQNAEAAAIRQAYGWKVFRPFPLDGIAGGLLWYLYRLKKIALKLRHGSYRPAKAP
jgi:glycosyltransferase involved in cell wall biosynthesis